MYIWGTKHYTSGKYGFARIWTYVYIMRSAGLEEAQAGIKIAGRNINNLGYADDTTLMVERKESLDEGERGEWKNWLKTQQSEN